MQVVQENKSAPPIPGVPKATTFPQYFETTLANGLRLLVIEHRALPIISLRLVIKSGSLYDGNLPGLASITGELITNGTTSRTATQIAEQIDFVGGQLAAGSDWDASFVTVNVLRKHLETGLRLMEDVTLHPAFPPEEFDRLKNQRVAILLQKNCDPDFLADRTFAETVYGRHPYAQQTMGTLQSLASVHNDDFIRFHSAAFVPPNAILAVVGDISPAEAMDNVQAMFGQWPVGDLPFQYFPEIPAMTGIRIVVVDRPGAVQSAIRIGHSGIARKNDDYIRVSILNTLFGGYFQSRINQNLRETHGYTYGANSSFDARKFEGPFIISADVRNEVTAPAVAEILNEMRQIRDKQVKESELSTVKSYIIGSFPLQIETPSQIASRAITIELFGLSKSYYSTFNDKVAAITAADVHAMARKYFHPDALAIVIAGNAEEIAPSLAQFGPVTVIETESSSTYQERIQ
jgi:predicted Zn-dependent peptidase